MDYFISTYFNNEIDKAVESFQDVDSYELFTFFLQSSESYLSVGIHIKTSLTKDSNFSQAWDLT